MCPKHMEKKSMPLDWLQSLKQFYHQCVIIYTLKQTYKRTRYIFYAVSESKNLCHTKF